MDSINGLLTGAQVKVGAFYPQGHRTPGGKRRRPLARLAFPILLLHQARMLKAAAQAQGVGARRKRGEVKNSAVAADKHFTAKGVRQAEKYGSNSRWRVASYSVTWSALGLGRRAMQWTGRLNRRHPWHSSAGS